MVQDRPVLGNLPVDILVADRALLLRIRYTALRSQDSWLAEQ